MIKDTTNSNSYVSQDNLNNRFVRLAVRFGVFILGWVLYLVPSLYTNFLNERAGLNSPKLTELLS